MVPAPVAAVDGQSAGAILFMCGMNAIRSPMAEAIARKRCCLASTYIVLPACGRRTRSIRRRRARGDRSDSLGRHQPQTLEELEDDYFDLIVTLSPEAHHAALRTDALQGGRSGLLADDGSHRGDRHARADRVDAYREVRDHLARLDRKHGLLERNGLAAQIGVKQMEEKPDQRGSQMASIV